MSLTMYDFLSIKNTEDAIAIMQAFLDGEIIEFTTKDGDNYVLLTKIGQELHEWNFKDWEYRIKK